MAVLARLARFEAFGRPHVSPRLHDIASLLHLFMSQSLAFVLVAIALGHLLCPASLLRRQCDFLLPIDVGPLAVSYPAAPTSKGVADLEVT